MNIPNAAATWSYCSVLLFSAHVTRLPLDGVSEGRWVAQWHVLAHHIGRKMRTAKFSGWFFETITMITANGRVFTSARVHNTPIQSKYGIAYARPPSSTSFVPMKMRSASTVVAVKLDLNAFFWVSHIANGWIDKSITTNITIEKIFAKAYAHNGNGVHAAKML